MEPITTSYWAIRYVLYILSVSFLYELYATLALFSVNLKTLYGWTDIFFSLSPFQTKEESFVSKYVLNRLETSLGLPSGRYCKLPHPPPHSTPPIWHILYVRLFLFAFCKHWASSWLRLLERCHQACVVRKVTGSSIILSDTFYLHSLPSILLRFSLLFYPLVSYIGY